MIKIIVIIRVDYYSKGYIIMSISKQQIELHHKYDMITNEALKLLANKKSRNYISVLFIKIVHCKFGICFGRIGLYSLNA